MKAALEVIDQGICPLCGQPNHCVVATGGRMGDPCWCWGVRAAPQALERVPPTLRHKVCLCRECLTRREWQDVPDSNPQSRTEGQCP